MSSEKPRYLYEDGNVLDRHNRQRQIGSLIHDIESGEYIATSYVKFISTCGYEGCHSCGEWAQERFATWEEADAWVIAQNEPEPVTPAGGHEDRAERDGGVR